MLIDLLFNSLIVNYLKGGRMIKRNIFIIFMLFTFSVLIFPQSLTVTEPDPGETWYKGSTYNITWTSSSCPDPDIKINIFKNSVSVANFIEQLTGPNNGSKSWTIPSSYATGNYVVRVKTGDDVCKGDSGVFKIADDPTPEATITVTSPAKDDKWEKGTEYKIEWDKDGTMGTSVKLTLHKYYTTTGVSSDIARTIAASTPNDGKFRWKIPTITLTGTYVIKVKTTDSLVTEDSEKFSIINPPPNIMFTSPPKTAYTGTKVRNRTKYTKVNLRKPDLQVTISFDPGITWVGNRTKIKFTVTNIGNLISKATLLKVSYGGPKIIKDEFHVTNLKPFEKFVKTINWIPLEVGNSGNRWWEGIVDVQNKMGDTKRQNNSARKMIIINASDLTVCVTTGRKTKRNVKISINITVKNIGKIPSTISRLRIAITEKKKKGYIIPALAPGETFVVTRRHEWKNKGKKYVRAWADYMKDVSESDEHNNAVEGIIHVVGILEDKTDSPKIVCSDGRGIGGSNI